MSKRTGRDADKPTYDELVDSVCRLSGQVIEARRDYVAWKEAAELNQQRYVRAEQRLANFEFAVQEIRRGGELLKDAVHELRHTTGAISQAYRRKVGKKLNAGKAPKRKRDTGWARQGRR